MQQLPRFSKINSIHQGITSFYFFLSNLRVIIQGLEVKFQKNMHFFLDYKKIVRMLSNPLEIFFF